MNYQWDFSFLLNYLPLLGYGALNTLRLAVTTFVAGMIIGLFAGLGRLSPVRLVRTAATVYVEIFRNLPGIVLIFWFYYAIPIITGWQSSVWVAATVALSLYTGAYCAEIYRAGIESVNRGQWEAARALGMNPWLRMRYVILPQALRRMIPAFSNRAIEVLKTTTLTSTLAFAELLYTAKLIAEDQFRPLEAFTAVSLLYTAICVPISYLSLWLERRHGPADGASS